VPLWCELENASAVDVDLEANEPLFDETL